MRAVADSSVIVAAALADHEAHTVCRTAIRTSSAGAAAHAWVESFSVLTRLPIDVRLNAADAVKVLGAIVPRTVGISQTQMVGFTTWLAGANVVGGAVYDALIAWTARSNRIALLTRDERAASTYEAVGIEFHLLNPKR